MGKIKKVGIIVFVLLILGFIALFIYSLKVDDRPRGEVIDLRSEYVFEDPENYEIEKKNGVNLVKNENLGFSFEIPSDWKIETYSEEIIMGEDIFAEGLLLFSPGYVSEETTIIPNSGCQMVISVSEEYHEYEDDIYYESDRLKWEIDGILEEKITKDDVTIIEIDNYYGYALGYKVDSPIRYIRIPVKGAIYEIEAYFSEQEIEKCKEAYHNLLNSVSLPENEK